MPSLASYLAKVYHDYLLELQRAIELMLTDPADVENLHKVRTTTRRIRTLLKVFKQRFDSDFLITAKPFFKELMEKTNEARDIDVFLSHFQAYKDSLPTSMREWIEPLRSFLRIRQKEAYQELQSFFTGEEFLQKFRTLYFARTINGIKAKKGIKKAIKQIKKELKQQNDLHRLRITYKRLRYVTELLLPFEHAKKEVKQLKKIQDLLGSYHDMTMQKKNIFLFVQQSDPTYQTALAAGKLMGDLEDKLEKLEKKIKRKDLI